MIRARCPSKTLAILVLLVTAGAPPVLASDLIRVPDDVATLQVAIDQIADGGTIEVSPGIYPSPAAGFSITSPGRRMTIRGLAGGPVVLDGGGTRPVLNYRAVGAVPPGPVVFENLVFRNGFSNTDGIAGGVTVFQSEATFVDCVFEDNVGQQPSTNTGAGGVGLFSGSIASFVGCRFENNSDNNEGGGLRVAADSIAWIHDSEFIGNRTNLPGHRNTAAGGAIYVGDASLRVSNTRFSGNQAGFAGGAIYAIGTWVDPVSVPSTDIVVSNVTFEDNVSMPDPGVSPPGPTEGGGLHVENQSSAIVFNSRFFRNAANNGGGLNLYRALVEVDDSVFRGNRATGSGTRGVGGGVQMISNDRLNDGMINRRTANLVVRNSVFQGRFGGTTTAALKGACIAATGDTNRQFGLGGVPQMGSAATNRAVLTVVESIFHDCDVAEDPAAAGTGVGGGINTSLTALTVTDSLITACDAFGPNGSAGGGLRAVIDSDVQVTNTTLAGNTSEVFGGAMSIQGSNIDIDGCTFVENEISPGVSEPSNMSFGAALFSGPFIGGVGNINATGIVRNSTFSNNIGMAIYEGDRDTGPINDIRYDGNTIFETTFGTEVFNNQLSPIQSVSGLNSLVVNRSGAPNTDKSAVNNVAPGGAPIRGAIVAAPAAILPDTAAGDAAAQTESFLGFTWSGATAQLDGAPVAGNVGLQTSSVGSHTLSVGGSNFQATIAQGISPAASLTVSPPGVPPGDPATLQWNLTAGDFINAAVDRGVDGDAGAAGMAVVQPPCEATYTYCVMTEQGGVAARATVGGGLLFSDGFESGDTSAWSVTVP